MIQDQPNPILNDSSAIQDLVIADIEERKQIGIQRYGTVLQAGNGRDSLRDAYEELLDFCVYFKQYIVEKKIAEKQPLTRIAERSDPRKSINVPKVVFKGFSDSLETTTKSCNQLPLEMPSIGSRWLNNKRGKVYKVFGAVSSCEGEECEILYRSEDMPEGEFIRRSVTEWYGTNRYGNPRFVPFD